MDAQKKKETSKATHTSDRVATQKLAESADASILKNEARKKTGSTAPGERGLDSDSNKEKSDAPRVDPKDTDSADASLDELPLELGDLVNDKEKSGDEVDDDDLLKVKKERDDLEDLSKRLRAEFENYRRRSLEERSKIIATASKDLLLELLPIVDNFEKAVSVKVEDEKLGGFLEGFRFVYQQLLDLLKSHGVSESTVVGDVFDPEKAEALHYEEGEDEEQTILEVYQQGYLLSGEVLRLAKVKVKKKKEKSDTRLSSSI